MTPPINGKRKRKEKKKKRKRSLSVALVDERRESLLHLITVILRNPAASFAASFHDARDVA